MLRRTAAPLAAALLLAAAAAAPAQSVDAYAPLGATTAGEVPPGGRPHVTGILLTEGTLKGLVQVKVARGEALAAEVSLVAPDGTVHTAEALAAAGAKFKSSSKGVTLARLPAFEETGLWKVLVRGAPGAGGRPTAGAFTLRVKGKPSKGFKVPQSTVSSPAATVDHVLAVPERGLLTLKLKPSKATPFGPSLRVLTPSGDEVSVEGFVKVGRDDSITVKNLPLPFFGDYVLRVGAAVGQGDYSLAVKVKPDRKGPPAGVPEADAGSTVVLEPGAPGALSAAASVGAVSYQWSQVGGPPVALASRSSVSPTLVAPPFRTTLVFQVVGRNAAGTSDAATVTVEVDRVPVAYGGPSARIPVPAAVTLDGTGSLDLDEGDVLTYSWTQTAGPAVVLDDPFSATPSFTPAADGVYRFELVVSDGTASSAPDPVLVSVGSTGPAGDAGRPVFVRPQDSVFLSGLGSRSSSGGTPATFAWTVDAGNPVAVTLGGASGAVASFTAPKVGARLRFRLTVDGSAGGADEVLVVVSADLPQNATPTAEAGGIRSLATGAPFVLDGSASTDDGTVAAFQWMQTSGPAVALTAAGASSSGTTPGSDAVLTFLLMVHDGRKYGAPDVATVVAGTAPSPVASAGPDRSGDPLVLLTLSSAASQPAPGQTLTGRQWTQVSGRDWYDVAVRDPGFVPTAASPQIRVPDSVASLTRDRVLQFSLVVTDGSGSSAADFVAVTFTNLPANTRPAVSASTTAAVFRPGTSVVMTSLASDADGDSLSYQWTQVSGASAFITNPTSPAATVTAPTTSGTLVFRVTVNDGTGAANAAASADVSFTVNQPPVVAISSTPTSGPAGQVVALSGTGTTDPDDGGLTYAWTEVPPAVGSPVTLSGASTIDASFTMPAYSGSAAQRRRTFRLTVTDSMGAAFAVSRTVEFTPNAVPVLNSIVPSGDLKVFYSNSAKGSDLNETLTAGPTTDADGDLLTFSWRILSGPSSVGSLNSTSGTSVIFGAPKPTSSQPNTGGVYRVGVTASDGIALSAEVTVQVLVTSSWASDIYPLISGGCNTGACHGSSASGGLQMTGGATTARTNLLSGRVTANDYANSLLYTKLQTGAMPKNAPPWSAELYNLVRDWIEPEHNLSTKIGLSGGAENN